MSKAVKKVFKEVKKAANWVAKNAIVVLAVAAIIYTGGAALGFFQGAAVAGGGLTGMAGIQAAWAPILGTTAAASGVAAPTIAAPTITGTGATIGATTGSAINLAGVTGLGAGGRTLASMAPTVAGIGAGVAAPAGMTAGQAFLGSAALQAGGAYLSAQSAADQAKIERERQDAERDRYNRETNAYGLNRYGQQLGQTNPGSFVQDFTFSPGTGLMAPRNTTLTAPTLAAPTLETIDDLIAARRKENA